jgi:hypothetical protein
MFNNREWVNKITEKYMIIKNDVAGLGAWPKPYSVCLASAGPPEFKLQKHHHKKEDVIEKYLMTQK